MLWVALRHGPIRNRWWRGEKPVDFTRLLGMVSVALAFFGPMLFAPNANQGPLLGMLHTGAIRLVAGPGGCHSLPDRHRGASDRA